MKTRCFIIKMVVLLAMASCTPKDHCRDALNASPKNTASPTLSAIDSLMWQQPDSALMRLLPYFDTCIATEYNRNYAHLLLAELLYKNDSAQTNRAELQQAVAYFDSLVRQVSPPFKGAGGIKNKNSDSSTHAFLDARAHYINGVGYYENDSAVPACAEYMKALEVMEGHFTEKELVGHKAQFMALTYTRLAMLFSDLYLHEQAIYFSQLSLISFRKTNNPIWHISRMLCEIGINYDIMDQLDSADYYYRNALVVLDDTNSLVYKDIVALRSFLFYKMENQKENTLLPLYRLLNQSNSETEYLSRCLTIGEVYYHEKQYDSAWYYLNNVYCHSNSIASKKQSAEWLKIICEIQGWDSVIYEYVNFLAPFANQEENTSDIKSHLTEFYNTFRQKVLERQHQQVLRKSMARTIAVVGGLFIVILVIVFLYHKNKKKLKHLESVKLDENETSSNTWDQYAVFMEESICQDIIHSIQKENIKRSATPKDYSNLVLSDEQLQQLAFAVNRNFGSFEHQLEQHGLKASPIMVNLCHLYLLGIDEKQAAILLNRDYSSISRYGKKLKAAFETQEKLTVFFRNLILNK